MSSVYGPVLALSQLFSVTQDHNCALSNCQLTVSSICSENLSIKLAGQRFIQRLHAPACLSEVCSEQRGIMACVLGALVARFIISMCCCRVDLLSEMNHDITLCAESLETGLHWSGDVSFLLGQHIFQQYV